MNKDKRKIMSEYIEYGCGFPVKLLNIPVIRDEDEWVPDINYNELDKQILIHICKMPYRLTGNQVRFIRLYFEKTLEEFAEIFKVRHSAVLQWEKQQDQLSKMHWGTELAMRLFALYNLETSSKKFASDYQQLLDQKLEEEYEAPLKLAINF